MKVCHVDRNLAGEDGRATSVAFLEDLVEVTTGTGVERFEPGKKIALDLQLPDLAVQIIDHLLRIFDRRSLCCTDRQADAVRSPHS